MELKDVRLKVEAFDYLQLPINITEGCIGRLVIQVICSTPCIPRAPCLCCLCISPCEFNRLLWWVSWTGQGDIAVQK